MVTEALQSHSTAQLSEAWREGVSLALEGMLSDVEAHLAAAMQGACKPGNGVGGKGRTALQAAVAEGQWAVGVMHQLRDIVLEAER